MSIDPETLLDWFLRKTDEEIADIAILDALWLLPDTRTDYVEPERSQLPVQSSPARYKPRRARCLRRYGNGHDERNER